MSEAPGLVCDNDRYAEQVLGLSDVVEVARPYADPRPGHASSAAPRPQPAHGP